MKLSICIPVYNFDVLNLAKDLRQEIEANQLNAELLFIDDASSSKFSLMLEELKKYADNVILLPENIGRSKIRNLFLDYCSGDYYLFTDCDIRITSSSFIQNYIKCIENYPDVDLFYGGFTIDETWKNLRNYYSVKREISNQYNTSDFNTFKTANFMIKKSVFEKFPFNENLRQYGYEDYIFAKDLELNSTNYLFINNPVMHLDYSSNEEFLQKIDQGMNSLYRLSLDSNYQNKIKDIKVYKLAEKLKKLHLLGLFRDFYKLFEKDIRKNLLSSQPNIYLFDLYKLGKLSELLK